MPALASLPLTTSSPIASCTPGPTIVTSATADGSMQDQEESRSEATIMRMSDSRGKDKERARASEAGGEESPKVCLRL
jgi:hypothetical protein